MAEVLECKICLDQLQNYPNIKCQHKFHADCLQSWLKISNICPDCKTVLKNCTEIQLRPANNIDQQENYLKGDGYIASPILHQFLFDKQYINLFGVSTMWHYQNNGRNMTFQEYEIADNLEQVISILSKPQQIRPNINCYTLIQVSIQIM